MLYIGDVGIRVDPAHRLVAPNSIRSQTLELLPREVRADKRAEPAALAAHERITETKMRLLGDRVSRRVRGRPRQFMVAWLNSRCSIL